MSLLNKFFVVFITTSVSLNVTVEHHQLPDVGERWQDVV